MTEAEAASNSEMPDLGADDEKTGKKEPANWWESKIALLLLGSLLTSFVVPWLQYTEKHFEWRRQTQYDLAKYELEQARGTLTEFIILTSFVAEAYAMHHQFVLKNKSSKADKEKFYSSFLEMQKRLFAESAKVSSLVIHLKDPQLKEQLQLYMDRMAEYLSLVEDGIASNKPPSESSIEDAGAKLDKVGGALINDLKSVIGKMEDKNEGFL